MHFGGYFGLELGIGESAILVVGAVLGGKSNQDLVFNEGTQDILRVVAQGLVEGKEGAVLVGSVEVEEVGDLEVGVEGVEIGGEGGEVREGEALLVLVDYYEVVGQPQEVKPGPIHGCVGQGGHNPVVVETVLVKSDLLKSCQDENEGDNDDRDDGDDDGSFIFFLHVIQMSKGCRVCYNLKNRNMDSDSERLETLSD